MESNEHGSMDLGEKRAPSLELPIEEPPEREPDDGMIRPKTIAELRREGRADRETRPEPRTREIPPRRELARAGEERRDGDEPGRQAAGRSDEESWRREAERTDEEPRRREAERTDEELRQRDARRSEKETRQHEAGRAEGEPSPREAGNPGDETWRREAESMDDAPRKRKEAARETPAATAERENRRPDKSEKQPKGMEQPDPDDRIAPDIDDWLEQLREYGGYQSSFDVQVREMTFKGMRTGLLFLSSFAKDTALTEVIKRLTYLDRESFVNHDMLESFLELYIPAIQVTRTRSRNKMIEEMLIGNSAFYIDGEPEVLLIDAKQYPARTPSEPVLEKVVRGSRDGFTETLLSNVALVRRRVRDSKLRFEILKVGTRTQTDIAVGYIEDIVDLKLLESVRDKIQAVNIDGIPLADKQLEEMTVKPDWNPFPLVRYSERPDVVASHMLNGSITVIVDTSPSVMLLPTTYFDLVQHAEENRQSPFIGTYLRWVRFFGILSSLYLLPLWFLFAQNAAIRPHWLWFLGADKMGQLPLIVQFLLVEIGVDLMRLAAVHTPTPLVTAMSLVSAILVGDIAVKTGLFVNEVILYMAVSAIGTFATPSYELGLANRIVRLALLIAAFLFKVPGFVIAATVVFIALTLVRSFNSPYMWPLVPFNAKGLLFLVLRRPLPTFKMRPAINRTRDSNKQPIG